LDAILTSEAVPALVPRAMSVTELTRILRDTLRSNPLLGRVLVRGETGNVQATAAGHVFFTLKDANAEIACVLFREDARSLGFSLGDGMEVVASGDVDLYARRGEVQIVIRALSPAGVGAFWAAFQRTRRALQEEGLFDGARKRPLPAFPKRVGVVTSEGGAVVHDIRAVLRRRYPLAEVLLAPALVQGPEAPTSLRNALAAVQGRVDVVILARGGGSLEDLWCFNDEGLARAVAACPVPVVSAVGHETDVTIVDFVADLRAPTPSAAAELVVPDAVQLRAHIEALRIELGRRMRDDLRERWTGLAALGERTSPSGYRRELANQAARVRTVGGLLLSAGPREILRCRERMEAVGRRLDALSPLATLDRGYAIVARGDGRLLTRAEDISLGEALRVRIRDGTLHARVEGKEVT